LNNPLNKGSSNAVATMFWCDEHTGNPLAMKVAQPSRLWGKQASRLPVLLMSSNFAFFTPPTSVFDRYPFMVGALGRA